MSNTLSHRKATLDDLVRIVDLMHDDELGQTRENTGNISKQKYINAFHVIDQDPNQYLMVVEESSQIIGTCHLTLMPSLTFTGSTRLNIEAVRIEKNIRSKNIGQWMIEQAVAYGKTKGATIIQLTTDKKRTRAKRFYHKMGFTDSHEGMKKHI